MRPSRRPVPREPLRRRPFGERSHSPLHEVRRDRWLVADRQPAIPRRDGMRRHRVT